MTDRGSDLLIPFAIDRDSGVELQDQIRSAVTSLIASGTWPAGFRVPSSRVLARRLGVSRNSAILALQRLIDDGFLESRPKRGLFVRTDDSQATAGSLVAGVFAARKGQRSPRPHTAWPDSTPAARETEYISFPFVDGLFDPDLFPGAGWKEATELAVKRKQIATWSAMTGDDPALIEQIRKRVLPRRGIAADTDEILLTLGAQHARALCIEYLCGTTSGSMAIEDPGQPMVRALVAARGGTCLPRPLDGEGMVLDKLDQANAVFVTPSHQLPTGTTMSVRRRAALLEAARRHDLVIVEDDFESETNYLDEALPALRGMQGGDRVMYMASLAKILDPGLCLGFIVADRTVIERLRQLRKLGAQQPPLNTQRTAAQFLALGHYDRMMRRLCHEFRDRITALRDALNHYLTRSVEVQPFKGGTTLWVRATDDVDAQEVAQAARRRGVLVETVEEYFAGAAPKGLFRLGITALPTGRIRPGIAALAVAFKEIASRRDPARATLAGTELAARLPGAVLHCRTVYGDPCTITLHADGSMSGTAGFAGEERDKGRWWILDDHWHRRWNSWAYGEEAAFRVSLDGDTICWLADDGRLIDWARIQYPENLDPR